MTAVTGAVMIALMEAIHGLATAHGNAGDRSQAVEHANAFLVETLGKAELRAEFLEQLATAHARGEISRDGYERILATVGRVLRNAAQLAEQIERLLKPEADR